MRLASESKQFTVQFIVAISVILINSRHYLLLLLFISSMQMAGCDSTIIFVGYCTITLLFTLISQFATNQSVKRTICL